jgi:hypothetical protein
LSLLVRNDAKSQMPCNIHYLRSKLKNAVKFLEVLGDVQQDFKVELQNVSFMILNLKLM